MHANQATFASSSDKVFLIIDSIFKTILFLYYLVMKKTLLISHILHIKTINTITRQAETKDGNHNSHRFDTGVKQFFFSHLGFFGIISRDPAIPSYPGLDPALNYAYFCKKKENKLGIFGENKKDFPKTNQNYWCFGVPGYFLTDISEISKITAEYR